MIVLLVVALLAGAVLAALWLEATLRLGPAQVPALEADPDDALGASPPESTPQTTTTLVAMTGPHDPARRTGVALGGPVALVQAGEGRADAAVLAMPPQLRVNEGGPTLSDVHAEDGLDGLVLAVRDYSGVAIDRAVTLTGDGLPRMVGALGGVERCDAQGCREIDADAASEGLAVEGPGAQAAEAVRLARAVADEVGPATPLRSPLATHRLISTVAATAEHDASLRGTALLDLAQTVRSVEDLGVAALPVVERPGDGTLVVPEQSMELFEHLRTGDRLPDDTASGAQALAADAVVGVLNGTGTSGFAGDLATRLEGEGFTVGGTDNAALFDHEQTVVRFESGDADAEIVAIYVARALGDDVEVEGVQAGAVVDGEPVDVAVVGGADLDDGSASDGAQGGDGGAG